MEADAGDEPRSARGGHDLAGAQRVGERLRALEFTGDHLHPGPDAAHGAGDPAGQRAATEGHEDRVHVGQLLEDLHADAGIARKGLRIAHRIHVPAFDLPMAARLDTAPPALEEATSITAAPRPRSRRSFAGAVPCAGTTTVAAIPARAAIHATAMPLLPELQVKTPPASSAALRASTALPIGRTLKEPTGCRFSSFRLTCSAPLGACSGTSGAHSGRLRSRSRALSIAGRVGRVRCIFTSLYNDREFP